MRKKYVRQSKTVAQQCRYYEVENFFDYMVETHLNSCDPKQIRKHYREMNIEGRKLFIRYCFDEMNPSYTEEIINIVAN